MPRSPSPYGGGQRRRRTEVSPPDYMDEFGGRHHQPTRSRGRGHRSEDDRTAGRGGMRGAFDAVKNFISESTEDGDRPRRAKSHREPRPRPYPPSDSDSGSPPPRRRRESPPPRAKPRAPEAPPPYDDYDDPNRPPRRRRTRDDDYYSDSRHDRPRRDPYDERPRRRDDYDEPPRRRDHDDRPRRRDPYDERYDDRPRRREPQYDDRPRRDRDPRYDDRLLRDPRDDRLRGRGSGKDVPEWQRQAKNMFYTHALPVIKKEGPRLIAKYAGDFLQKGGARR